MQFKTMIMALALVLTTSLLYAQPGSRPATGYQAQPAMANPGVRLKQGMDSLLAFLRQPNRPDQALIAAYLEQNIAPFFDFAYMGKSAAGLAYRDMSPVQRAQLTQKIKENFLATLAKRLVNYQDQRIRYLAHRVSADQRTAVAGVAILSPRSYPARLDFRFYKGKDGWKVFDVMANGQSTIVFYRRQFRQLITAAPQQRQHGYTPGYPYRR